MAKILEAISLGAIALNAEAIQLDGETPRSRIQIAKTGSWPASNKRKGGFSITKSMLRDMVKNTAQELPIDYNHLSMNAILPEQGVAAGWMEKLELEDGDTKMFATARWTPKAAGHIKQGEFRYISPTFLTDCVDPASGENVGAKLLSAALTNYPFLQGMQPVALSELEQLGVVKLVDSGDLTFDEKRSRVVGALYEKFRDSSEYVEFQDLTDDYVVVRRAGRLFKLGYAIKSDATVEFEQEFKEVVHSYAELTSLPPSNPGAPRIMPDNPNEPTLLSLQSELQRVTGLVTSLQNTVNEQATQLTAANTRNETLELELKKRDARDKVSQLIKDGKILPKQKEQFEAIALTNIEWFDSFTATLEPVVALNTAHGTGQVSGAPASAISTGDASLDQRIAAAQGDEVISLMDEMIKKHRKDNNSTYSEAMHAVSNAYPSLVERYRAAFVVAGSPGQVQ